MKSKSYTKIKTGQPSDGAKITAVKRKGIYYITHADGCTTSLSEGKFNKRYVEDGTGRKTT